MPLRLAKSTICGVVSTGTLVEPLSSVTPVTITWHETTLGSGASVPIVKTEAVWSEAVEDFEDVWPPQPDRPRTTRSPTNTSIAGEFPIANLLIERSIHAEPKKRSSTGACKTHAAEQSCGHS